MDPIDLSKDLPFHPSLWIGVGKKLSDSLPQEVLDAHKEILEIPGTFHNSLPTLLPPQNLLLRLHSPAQANQTQLVEVSSKDIKEFDMITAQNQAIEVALFEYKEE